MVDSELDNSGAEFHPDALSDSEFGLLNELGNSSNPSRPGQRLYMNEAVNSLAKAGSTLQNIAVRHIGPNAKAVRAVLFDKTADNNWPLGWHQDRTICVKKRSDAPGFGPFTVKDGVLHVQPPAEVISGMVTLRAHLDPCNLDNAPLKIAIGTHKLGLVLDKNIANAVANAEIQFCIAQPGSVWVYRTLIIHASDAAMRPARRRVLQIDFAAEELPEPLEWLGI
jgi:hypothetical protein